jgi:hypothetical protein
MHVLPLKNCHLLLNAELISHAFPGEQQVRIVYYAERRALLVAPKSDIFFEKMHQTSWLVLKDRNPRGDKSLAVRDVLLDNDLDLDDREVPYELENTGVLCVNL